MLRSKKKSVMTSTRRQTGASFNDNTYECVLEEGEEDTLAATTRGTRHHRHAKNNAHIKANAEKEGKKKKKSSHLFGSGGGGGCDSSSHHRHGGSYKTVSCMVHYR